MLDQAPQLATLTTGMSKKKKPRGPPKQYSPRTTTHLMFPIKKLKPCLPDGFKSHKVP